MLLAFTAVGCLTAQISDQISGTPPGTILGLVALVVSGAFGLAGKISARKDDLEKAEMRHKIADLEKAERACSDSQAAIKTELSAKIAAQEKEINELKIKASANTTPTGFYVWADERETILDVTDGVKTVLGWRPTELVGKSLNLLIPETDRDRYEAGIKTAIADGKLRLCDIALKTTALRSNNTAVNVTVSLDPDPTKGPGIMRAEVTVRGGLIE